MRFLVAFSLCLTLSFLPASLSAEEATFAGGVVNISSVQRGAGAAISLEVRQTFETSTPTYINTSGAGGNSALVPGSFTAGSPVYTLRSEELLPVEYRATASISANALDCSRPQDICYGCISRNFSGPLRFLGDGLQNVDPNNRSYSVTTRYSVAQSSSNPAPNYTGPTFIRLPVGKFNEVNLKPFIRYGGLSYSCSLKPASFRNGLLENPRTATHSLQVTEDCRLRWNTESGVVGSKFAFQLIIDSDVQAPRPPFAPASWSGCFPRTEVDFLLEIGCSEEDLQTGNPDCFLCSSQNLDPYYAKIAEDTNAWTAVSRRINNIARRVTRRCNASGFAQRATRKWGSVSRKRTRQAKTQLADISLAAKSEAGQCLAPSPFFCSTESLRETKQSFRDSLIALAPATRRVARNSRAIENEVGSCLKAGEKRRLRNLRRRNRQMLNTVLDTVNLLPDDSMSCGV